MSCCGKKREQLRAESLSGAGRWQAPAPPQTPTPRRADTIFQYVGRTSLTIVGPISGVRYHFAGPGVRLRVDSRDRRSLASISELRQTA
jgi:hypothetical protein